MPRLSSNSAAGREPRAWRLPPAPALRLSVNATVFQEDSSLRPTIAPKSGKGARKSALSRHGRVASRIRRRRNRFRLYQPDYEEREGSSEERAAGSVAIRCCETRRARTPAKPKRRHHGFGTAASAASSGRGRAIPICLSACGSAASTSKRTRNSSAATTTTRSGRQTDPDRASRPSTGKVETKSNWSRHELQVNCAALSPTICRFRKTIVPKRKRSCAAASMLPRSVASSSRAAPFDDRTRRDTRRRHVGRAAAQCVYLRGKRRLHPSLQSSRNRRCAASLSATSIRMRKLLSGGVQDLSDRDYNIVRRNAARKLRDDARHQAVPGGEHRPSCIRPSGRLHRCRARIGWVACASGCRVCAPRLAHGRGLGRLRAPSLSRCKFG